MNQKLLRQLQSENIEVDIERVEAVSSSTAEESELDEMWSFVLWVRRLILGGCGMQLTTILVES